MGLLVTETMQQIKTMALSLKNDGFSASFKRYGWRMISLVITYYLVRDISLYLVIPYFLSTSI